MSWLRGCLALLVFAWLAAGPIPARATILCSQLSSPGISINYTNNTVASTQSFFRVTCSRAPGDATSVTFSVSVDNGGNAAGNNNQAMNGAAALRYDTYTNSACGTPWRSNSPITGTITWTSNSDTSPITREINFWGCITQKQTATNSGLYADTVRMTLSYPSGPDLIANMPVSIYAPATCSFTRQPGNILIADYIPFTSGLRTGSTQFGVQCTNQMPYTLATNVQEGVAAGVRYLLSVNQPGGSGTGQPQDYFVTVTVPGGQAGGACSLPSGQTCTTTNSHWIVISY